jgi:hypothetical protein
MLVRKPEGMCTVATDPVKRTVTLGFHTTQESQAFRDQVVDRVIETTQGNRKPAREYNMPLHLTEDERNTAVGQTMIETIEGMRKQAQFFRSTGNPEMAIIIETRAKQIEDDVNDLLDQFNGVKK